MYAEESMILLCDQLTNSNLERLLNRNYTIAASSKKANVWAFFTAAFIVAGTVVLFIIKKK